MDHLDQEPAHVAIIFDDTLRVRASGPDLRFRLAAQGFAASLDREGLHVSFETHGDHLANPSLTRLVQGLAASGVAFSHDFRQRVSPAEHVRLLLQRGVAIDSPMSCTFDGHRWSVAPIDDAPGRR